MPNIFTTVFFSVPVLTLLSGASAIWLCTTAGDPPSELIVHLFYVFTGAFSGGAGTIAWLLRGLIGKPPRFSGD